jgi:hypothetical protein
VPEETIAVVLLTLGAFVSLANWASLVLSLRTGRFCSSVPLLGAGFLVAGALLLPTPRPYAWAGVLLDFGTLALLLALPMIVREMWATCRFNLLEEYVGRRGATTVYLRLFRRGVFTLRWDIRRAAGEHGVIGMGNIGTWEREADTLVLHYGEELARFTRLAEGDKRGWTQSAGFGHCVGNSELSLEGLELVLSP